MLTQVSDLADAVVIQSLVSQLHPLELVLLFASCLDVLLPDELQELAHLVRVRVTILVIITAAWTILIVLLEVLVEQLLNDSLELWSQMAL